MQFVSPGITALVIKAVLHSKLDHKTKNLFGVWVQILLSRIKTIGKRLKQSERTSSVRFHDLEAKRQLFALPM
jgi:hypothetical protein